MMYGSLLVLALALGQSESTPTIRVGSKLFTESVVLGEMVSVVAGHSGLKSTHTRQLGGTGIVWKALLDNQIDIYPEYTGTIAENILREPGLRDEAVIRDRMRQQGIFMSKPLGFRNQYAIGMAREYAARLNITKTSDLASYPKLKLGFGNEFLDRSDGWKSMRVTYSLPHSRVKGLDHSLCYWALESGEIRAMDVYTTDPNIKLFDLTVLEDDLQHFPPYKAVFLIRQELLQTAPEFVKSLLRLEGSITESAMLDLNEEADVEQHEETLVAHNFVATTLGLGTVMPTPDSAAKWKSFALSMLKHTREHLFLVGISLMLAICVAVPLGIIAARTTVVGQIILGVSEVIQTIPGLALLILLMTPLKMLNLNTVGALPAIIALFLYSLLPIIRNTYAGITDLPPSIRESARALGLTAWAQLTRIEIPMASRLILAGVKTTAVINVGYATLGGLIGAGGYGQLIMQGLRQSRESKMLEGAIPAALMALAVKFLFEYSERFVVPKGLRV